MSERPGELFETYQMGSIELKNRIILAPMTRSRAGEGNAPTDLNVEYYRQRASAGLLVTEATQISPQGVGYPATPGIYSVTQVAGWKKITAAVHAEGGKIFAQLWHVGRISHRLFQPNGEPPVAPSAIAPEAESYTQEGLKRFETPRALETDEIAAIVQDYAKSTRLAIDAGFDGVELHAANGYLIDQFIRDGSNRRTGRYGGSVENRARFLIEIVDAVSAEIGADRVGIRISPLSPFNSMADSEPERTFLHIARKLAGRGLAYLHIVELSGSGPDRTLAPKLKAAFGGTVILNTGYDKESGTAALREGRGDLIAYGSLFLANPDLPRRFELDAPLNDPDPQTFYGGDHKGYTDYPTLDASSMAS